jgi:hypothetical protein
MSWPDLTCIECISFHTRFEAWVEVPYSLVERCDVSEELTASAFKVGPENWDKSFV